MMVVVVHQLLENHLMLNNLFVEDTPLGNAGALFQIKDQLTDDFFIT